MFQSLYIDVDHLDYSSLKSILRLAGQGLPVCVAKRPVEPGKVKHADYDSLLDQLMALSTVSAERSVIPGKPLVEGTDIPDFWCREDGGTMYLFFANPLASTISYPLEYCYAFSDKGSKRVVKVNHHGRSDEVTLDFSPMESILLKADKDGVKKIDLGYSPTRLRED